jgi:SAM-dependent methyltransferase
LTQPYTSQFYAERKSGSNESANAIVPLVLELVQCSSVIDIGCGTGEWLSVFSGNGVTDILGVDGNYVDKDLLQIPGDKFVSFDLRKGFATDRSFDLAVSLEVAEHLPSEYGTTFINSLTKLSPVVLFSAAVPFQEGTDHVNEQWPDYWAEQFRKNDFVPVDCLRRKLWQNAHIDWWYRQNIMFYVHRDELPRYPLLQQYSHSECSQPLPIIHPSLWLYKSNKIVSLESELAAARAKWQKLQSNRGFRILTRLNRLFRPEK